MGFQPPPGVANRQPLADSALVKLPLGSIRPGGWLAEQLRLQAEGLTGHLDRLFDDVGPNSAWLGGAGEDWERGPYYARGLTALAYATFDPNLIAKARPWLDWSIDTQREDGFFGPLTNTDWWPRMVMLQAIQMHHEATGDPRVVPFMTRYFRYQLDTIESQPLKKWAMHRGGDNTESVYWLYNRTGETFLLELANILIRQTYDWSSDLLKDAPIDAHVVNLSQGYKQPGIIWQQTRENRHRDAVFKGLEHAMTYHGQIEGLHSGDEPTAGKGSTRGTELCAMVEFMLSAQTLLKIFGDPSLADRMERVVLNALPASIAPDWRSHQYFIQPNQVLCTRGPHGFATDHGDDITFGVLAGFPCCAVNMHMGYPMLAHHLWMATPDEGLAAIFYAPCEVNTTIRGVPVRISEETDYPFLSEVRVRIRPERPVEFTVMLRIPAWCDQASVRVQGGPAIAAPAGAFLPLSREWKAGDEIVLELPMALRTSEWENGSVGVEYGPLVFSLAVDEDWRQSPDWRRKDAVDDFPAYELHPKSPWNYGLMIDRANPSASLRITRSSVPAQPWSPESAPIRIRARARRIPGWTLGADNNAAPPPPSPVLSSEPVEEVTLLPFGATRMRITYVPVLA